MPLRRRIGLQPTLPGTLDVAGRDAGLVGVDAVEDHPHRGVAIPDEAAAEVAAQPYDPVYAVLRERLLGLLDVAKSLCSVSLKLKLN